MDQSQTQFNELYKSYLFDVKIGATLNVEVIDVNNKYVTVESGLKSESIIPTNEFMDGVGKILVSIGDRVDVLLEEIEDGTGSTILSYEKLKREKIWESLISAHQNDTVIKAVIENKIKSGYNVAIDIVNSFLPDSLIEIEEAKSLLEDRQGEEIEFKVVKIVPKKNIIVLSRKAVLNSVSKEERMQTFNSIEIGGIVEGAIKNITSYGAFIDLGAIDGLLHITDLSWKRIRHPSYLLKMGQKIKVKVLSKDEEHMRLSLGLKQLESNPWDDLTERYPKGKKIKAVVSNITDYGFFAEIEKGIEGLVHVSEMDWAKKNIHPSKVVTVGDEVELMVLNIDSDLRRISLGMKQCIPNPWQTFIENIAIDQVVTGKIKTITDFGIFIELNENVDGLIHVSDISWNQNNIKTELAKFQKTQEIESKVLNIDVENERISLGLKQLSDNPVEQYIKDHPENSKVTGKVVHATSTFMLVELTENVVGYIKTQDLDKKDNKDAYKVGDEVQVFVLNHDTTKNNISLSMHDDSKQENQIKSQPSAKPISIGELIKNQLNDD